MKKLLYIIIGVPLLLTAACSNDSDADMVTAMEVIQQDAIRQANMLSRGTFHLVWMMDNSFVDNAVLSSELDPYYMVITHFPICHLYNSRIATPQKRELFVDSLLSFDRSSYWLLDLSYIGYSTSNAYMANKGLAPRTYFKYNGVDYAFQIWFKADNSSGENTALMYNMEKDVWSGSATIDSFAVINMETKQTDIWRGRRDLLFVASRKK